MTSKYEITWTDFAEKQLDLIFDYCLVEAGYGVARKIIQSLVS
jgi:plasmid stabilization system protein ParE